MNEKLRHLDLFSGIGGFALGLESTGGFKTVGFCDNEPFAQKVLKKHWPDVPCYEDVRDVGVETVGYRGVDIITGGFPCQPFSVAGKQDPKDNRQLWPEMFRIIKEIRPTYVIGENVRNLISIREGVVFEQVCTDLEGEGYQVQTFVLPASAVNAPHQRYRCWIVGIMADSNSGMRRGGRAISESRENKKRRLHTKKEKQTSHDLRSKTVGCDSMGRETKNVSDTNNTGDRTSRSRTDKNRQKKVKGWEEQPQSEPSRHSKDVADTSNWRGEQTEWQRGEGVGRGSFDIGRFKTKGQKDKQNVADSTTSRSQTSSKKRLEQKETEKTDAITSHGGNIRNFNFKNNWTVEPSVGRVAHGIPNRVDRLKGLGNAVVPQIPAVLGRAILEVHDG